MNEKLIQESTPQEGLQSRAEVVGRVGQAAVESASQTETSAQGTHKRRCWAGVPSQGDLHTARGWALCIFWFLIWLCLCCITMWRGAQPMLYHFPSAGEAPSLSQQKVQKRPWGSKSCRLCCVFFFFSFPTLTLTPLYGNESFPFSGSELQNTQRLASGEAQGSWGASTSK